MPAENIFAQFARPVRSVSDHLASYDAQDMRKLQLEGSRRQNALAAITQQQTMRAMADSDADRNALQTVASGWNAQTTPEQRIAALRNSGRSALMTQADALEKQAIERTKGDAEAKAKQAEVLGKVLTAQGELATRVMANPTPQAAAAAIANMKAITQALGVQIDFSGDEAALGQFQSPDQIKQWAAGHALKADQLLPKLQALNAGGQYVNQAVNPVTGKVAETGRTDITQSADNRANNARMSADAAASRAQSASQFNQRLAYDKEKDKTTAAGGPAKPLPAGAMKMQQESLDAIGISSSINADLGGIERQIDGGKLSFGPVSNLTNAARNMAGVSSEESRNFASFKSTLERLRNESLRLNAGVQTDGDAQRAWNELFQNINDTGLVKQRLAEIQGINKRGAQLHQLRVDSIRSNYNAGPLDAGAYKDQPAAVGASAQPSGGPKRIGSDAEYEALPSGATFVGPDGKTRRKP